MLGQSLLGHARARFLSWVLTLLLLLLGRLRGHVVFDAMGQRAQSSGSARQRSDARLLQFAWQA